MQNLTEDLFGQRVQLCRFKGHRNNQLIILNPGLSGSDHPVRILLPAHITINIMLISDNSVTIKPGKIPLIHRNHRSVSVPRIIRSNKLNRSGFFNVPCKPSYMSY